MQGAHSLGSKGIIASLESQSLHIKQLRRIFSVEIKFVVDSSLY